MTTQLVRFCAREQLQQDVARPLLQKQLVRRMQLDKHPPQRRRPRKFGIQGLQKPYDVIAQEIL
jgi:hypothetical protein